MQIKSSPMRIMGVGALALALAFPLSALAQTGQGQAPASSGSGAPGQPPQPSQPPAARSPGQGAAPAQSRAQGDQSMSRADMRFLREAVQGNMAEVNMGQIAQQNGQSDDVKRFGQMLATDHGRANEELMKLGSSATLPQEPTAKQKREAERFQRMQGDAFDRAFARMMVEEHRKDIAKYKRVARGKGALADYASNALPDLEKHLKAAEDLRGAEGRRR